MTVLAAADEVRARSLSQTAMLWQQAELASVWENFEKQRSISAHIESTRDIGNVEGVHIFEDADLRQIALCELAIITAKAAHVTRALQRCHDSGYYTVSAFNAFHGALFSARALMGIFGVFSFSCNFAGRDRNCLLDIFPWLGAVDQARRFEREHGNNRALVRLSGFNKKIESQDIWKVFCRILRIASLECISVAEQRKLEAFEYKLLSKRRNALLYQPPAWSWPLDIVRASSRYFSPAHAQLNLLELLELAEEGDTPEFIVNGLLFVILERAWRRVVPEDFRDDAPSTAIAPTLLFGAELSDTIYSRPPLSFIIR